MTGAYGRKAACRATLCLHRAGCRRGRSAPMRKGRICAVSAGRTCARSAMWKAGAVTGDRVCASHVRASNSLNRFKEFRACLHAPSHLAFSLCGASKRALRAWQPRWIMTGVGPVESRAPPAAGCQVSVVGVGDGKPEVLPSGAGDGVADAKREIHDGIAIGCHRAGIGDAPPFSLAAKRRAAGRQRSA